MSRLIIRLIAALLTFTIGLASNMLWISPNHNPSEKSQSSSESRIFKQTRWSKTQGWWKHIYESNDGAMVIVERWDRADGYVEARLYNAEKILDRRPVLNIKGEKVGERVVALHYHREYGYPRHLILWTDGLVLHTIHATSLSGAMLFEKDYRR